MLTALSAVYKIGIDRFVDGYKSRIDLFIGGTWNRFDRFTCDI